MSQSALDEQIQQHHANRPEHRGRYAEFDSSYRRKSKFRLWETKLHELYAARDKVTKQHSSMNPPPLYSTMESIFACGAFERARKYARSLVNRYDDEIDSAVGLAVTQALRQWNRDDRLGNFDQLLKQWVINCVRAAVRDLARWGQRFYMINNKPDNDEMSEVA